MEERRLRSIKNRVL